MEAFRNRGHTFDSPEEARRFEEIKSVIDQATSEVLMTVDWGTNMNLVDMINNTRSERVLSEVVRQIRKKLQSKTMKVVLMALHLIETLVKNCHTDFHRQVQTDKFMAQLKKLGKTYADRRGREHLEVSDKALDLVQSWGEAFLPQSHALPLFSKTYHDLCAEGVKFPTTQYDEGSCPIFTPPPVIPDDDQPDGGGGGGGGAGYQGDDTIDAATAAAIAAASEGDFDLAAATAVAASTVNERRGSDGGDHGGGGGGGPPASTDNMLGQVTTSVEMLSEVLHAAQTLDELRQNDFLDELVGNCERLQPELISLIENAMETNPDGMEPLLQQNDELQRVLELFRNINAQTVALPLPREEGGTTAVAAAAAAAAAVEGSNLDYGSGSERPNLLDFNGDGHAPLAPVPAAPAEPAASDILDFRQATALPTPPPAARAAAQDVLDFRLNPPKQTPVALAPPPSGTMRSKRSPSRSPLQASQPQQQDLLGDMLDLSVGASTSTMTASDPFAPNDSSSNGNGNGNSAAPVTLAKQSSADAFDDFAQLSMRSQPAANGGAAKIDLAALYGQPPAPAPAPTHSWSTHPTGQPMAPLVTGHPVLPHGMQNPTPPSSNPFDELAAAPLQTQQQQQQQQQRRRQQASSSIDQVNAFDFFNK